MYPQLSQLPQLLQPQLHLLYLQLRHDQLEGCLRTSLDQQVIFIFYQTKDDIQNIPETKFMFSPFYATACVNIQVFLTTVSITN